MTHHRNRRRRVAMRLLASIALALALAGCGAVGFGLLNAGGPGTGAVERSVVYDATHGLSLDVHRPRAATGSVPLVVFFYGGSWQNGSRTRYAFAGEALAALGVVAVVPDYRLYPAVRFPGFMHDAARAVAWSRAAAHTLGADPDRIVLMGHSAGAQIAALLATDPRYLAEAGVPASAIAGVVGLSGPYDFDPRGYPALEAIFGAPEDWPRARPVNFVDAHDPPFLLVHGSGDRTVYAAQSEHLAQRLRTSGVAVDLVLLPGVGHIRPLLALRYPSLGPVLDQAGRFIAALPARDRAGAAEAAGNQ